MAAVPEVRIAGKPSDTSSGRPADTAASASLRRAMARNAAAFHKDIASLERLDRVMKAAAAPPRATASRIEAGLLDAGDPGSLAGPIPGLPGKAGSIVRPLSETWPYGVRGRSGAAGAGRGSGSGMTMARIDPDPFTAYAYFEGDTSWFVFDDSAQGSILRIHVFNDADGEEFRLVKDSMAFRFPYDEEAPVLLASATRFFYPDGSTLYQGLSDDDGDGALATAPQGLDVRLRREWLVVSGDSAWKSVWRTDHGLPALGGTLGEGLALSFADTLFVKDEPVTWSRAFDADGDGFALEAAPGNALKVGVESFSRGGDGLRRYFSNAYGPGADGDIFASADNPLYPWTLTVLAPGGDTVSQTRFGDQDGDGFYSDPAPGAANRVWEIRRCRNRPGYRTYRDSLARILNRLGDRSDDGIAYYRADAEYEDGGEAHLACGSQNGSGIAGEDTMVVRESRSFLPSGNAAQADPDTDPAAAEAAAGDLDSLVQVTLVIPGGLFDPADDSILNRISRGYARNSRGSATLWYDPGSGRFLDTLPHQGGQAEGSAYEASGGTYHPADGTGEFARKEVSADGDSTVTRVGIVGDGPGRHIVKAVLDGKTAIYHCHGDSASWTEKSGDTVTTCTRVARADGSFSMLQVIREEKGGTIAEAAYTFGPDGSGSGSYREFADGKARQAVVFAITSDGGVAAVPAAKDNGSLSAQR
ncbi:MAG: hypothetical protein JWP91_1664 [Fibrobacteres bacterium]|nr:hypothetical protein [Fibrobacterota bacterium]